MGETLAWGKHCLWWGDVLEAKGTSDGPVCPHCGGPLGLTDRETWRDAVKKLEAEGKCHLPLLAWCRGKCFANPFLAKAAFILEARGM